MSNSRCVVYHWVCQYSDNTALPQYDPYTFKINKFDDIDTNRLVKFGLYPFTSELAIGMKNNGVNCISVPFLPSYEINIGSNMRPIYYRDVFIQQETFHKCGKCNKEFFVGSDIKLINGKYKTPICPHCGAYDYFYCKRCDKKFTYEESHRGSCPLCDGPKEHIKLTSEQSSRERRWTEYVVGYQQTINGRNYKTLLHVSENGNVEVKYE